MHTQELLHEGAFTQRSLYTKQSLHRLGHRVVTLRSLYTEQLLQTEAFTHRSFYTEKSLHRGAFTHRHRSFCTEKSWHRSIYTQKLLTEKSLHRGVFTHRSFYTREHLHWEAFTRKRIFTQKLLHRAKFTQASFYTQKHWHASFHTQKHLHFTGTGPLPERTFATLRNGNFTAVSDVRPSFVRKGCICDFKIAILRQSWHSTFVSCERVASEVSKTLHKFLTFLPHFVRNGWSDLAKFQHLRLTF